MAEAESAPVSKATKAQAMRVRAWLDCNAISTAETNREEALRESSDSNNAITARHEATAMELFAAKMRNPRQRWEVHGVVE